MLGGVLYKSKIGSNVVIDSGVKVSVGRKSEGGNDLHRGQRESNKQTRGMNYFADK